MSNKNACLGKAKREKHAVSRRLYRLGLSLPAAGGLVFALAPAAHAFSIYDGSATGANNVEINLDITASYSGLYRVQQPKSTLVGGATNSNGNDGDANFRHGLVGNTFEVLPVLDIKDNNFGMHFSGEYFLNTVYLQQNQNNQAATNNSFGLPRNTDFNKSTRQADGQNGRLLDAFVYDSFNFNDGQSVTVKLGKQTLFWGQSLFFGTNGISGGQAPIDVVAADNLVNPETQQIFLPVNQAVLTYKPNSTYTLQGFYQFEWAPYALEGVGSYFSGSEVVGPGAERIIGQAGTTSTNGFYFYKTKALTPPSQNGQFGGSIQAQYGNYDVGLFGLRFDNKTPQVYTVLGPFNFADPRGPSIGTFRLVYPRDIQLYGASLSTTIGATNVAGEISGRRNQPLVGSAGPSSPGGNAGNAGNDALYPVGNTLTGLTSFIYGSPALKYDPGGVTVVGEVEYLKVLGVTANKAALAPGRSSSSASFDISVTPTYYEVLPHLQLSFPVSLKYNFAGNSQFDPTANHGTGNYAVGISATYHTTYTASLNYVGFFGKADPNTLAPEVQALADRGYINLNLQHTF